MEKLKFDYEDLILIKNLEIERLQKTYKQDMKTKNDEIQAVKV